MATLVVGQSGRFVGRETVGVVGAVEPAPPHELTTASSQQPSALECIGYAVLFSMATALIPNANTIGSAHASVGTHQAAIARAYNRSWIKGTPPQLIPALDADAVDAVNYTVGTHQQALASQNRSWAKGTPPQLVPAAEGVFRPVSFAAPLHVESGSARVFKPPTSYLAIVSATGITIVKAPEHLPPAPAHVWGTAAGIDTAIGRTLVEAPEQLPSGPAWVWGTAVAAVVVDTPTGRTLVEAPEYPQDLQPTLFSPPVSYLAIVSKVAGTQFAFPQQPDQGSAQVFQGPPEIVLDAVDAVNYTVGTHQLILASQNRSWVKTTHPLLVTPPTLDARVAGTLVAAPPQVYNAAAIQFQVPYEYYVLAGANVRIGRTWITVPPHVPSGSSQTFNISLEYFIPPVLDAKVAGTMVAAPEHKDSALAVVSSMLQPGPSLSLVAMPPSILAGQFSTLIWDSMGATTLSATDGWAGLKALSGSEVVGPLFVTTLFGLTAVGPSGSIHVSVTVTVSPVIPPLPPSPSIEVRPGGRIIVPSREADVTIPFDFISSIQPMDSIVAQVVTAAVYSGVDPNPAAILLGSPTVDGLVVSQRVRSDLEGIIYKLLCHVTTASGSEPEISTYYTALRSRGT